MTHSTENTTYINNDIKRIILGACVSSSIVDTKYMEGVSEKLVEIAQKLYFEKPEFSNGDRCYEYKLPKHNIRIVVRDYVEDGLRVSCVIKSGNIVLAKINVPKWTADDGINAKLQYVRVLASAVSLIEPAIITKSQVIDEKSIKAGVKEALADAKSDSKKHDNSRKPSKYEVERVCKEILIHANDQKKLSLTMKWGKKSYQPDLGVWVGRNSAGEVICVIDMEGKLYGDGEWSPHNVVARVDDIGRNEKYHYNKFVNLFLLAISELFKEDDKVFDGSSEEYESD